MDGQPRIEDVAAFLQQNITTYLEEWLPNGKIVGREYIVKNPTRNDRTAGSFKVNMDTGAWADFAMGHNARGGDLVSLNAYLLGIGQKESADKIMEDYDLKDKGPSVPISALPKSGPKYKVIMPVPSDAPAPPHKLHSPTHGLLNADHVYRYENSECELLGYVLRADAKKGRKKEIRPLMYCEADTGGKEWIFCGFPTPTPLYKLELLGRYPAATVVMVEGEKCVDMANDLFLSAFEVEYIALTWAGGSAQVEKADFIPLKGRNVLCWPDNDDPGRKCMNIVAERAGGKVLALPERVPEKWDVADAIEKGWGYDEIMTFLSPLVNINPMQRMPHDNYVETTAKGVPLNTKENFREILRFYNVNLHYDCISKQVLVDAPWISRQTQRDSSRFTPEIMSLCSRNGFPTSMTSDYLFALACDNEINPVATWVTSKPWDGVSRIRELCDSLVTDVGHMRLRDIYVQKWLVSAVAAAFSNASAGESSFRSRGVLVLQGEQGIGKTTWGRILAGGSRFFGEGMTLDIGNKDSVKMCISKWITELGELESTLKRDITTLKAFLSNTHDELRMPYARGSSIFPRQTVFIATVNSSLFLNDETGNDRFWVIPCREVLDIKHIDVQQLWAEVKILMDSGEPWWLNPGEIQEMRDSNGDFMVKTAIEDVFENMLNWDEDESRWEDRTPTEVWYDIFGRPPTHSERTRAGFFLRERFSGTFKHTKKGSTYLIPPVKPEYKRRREFYS